MRKVDHERWQAAQRWELDLWRREARVTPRAHVRRLLSSLGLVRLADRAVGLGDDWNQWWKERFDDYSFLPARVERALELGCGPFTNIRLIMMDHTFNSVCCSDPLAREYLGFRGTWLAEAFRRGLVEIDDHPAEQVPFPDNHFDVTVMVNVLDHVQDLDLCLATAIRVTRPGGILILGQDLTDDRDDAGIGKDLGHPIRVTHDELDEILGPVFEPIMRKVLGREEGRNPRAHYGTYIYAGSKR